MGAGDPIEIDTPLGNKKSGRKDEVAAGIERLKKEQKKAQMRFKLYCLREHKTQEFIQDISEQKSYMQKLALKRAKKSATSMYIRKKANMLLTSMLIK